LKHFAIRSTIPALFLGTACNSSSKYFLSP
jgi:hypothetical protein